MELLWHLSQKITHNLPLGLHLEFLPPYSPELQPAERIWPIVDEPLANRSFTKNGGIRRNPLHQMSSNFATTRIGQRNY